MKQEVCSVKLVADVLSAERPARCMVWGRVPSVDRHHWVNIGKKLQLGMCVAAFFLSPKKHRSVTTKILLPDMFLRCDTKNIRNFTILTDIVFVRQDAKKGTALRDGVGSSTCFSSDRRASKDAN